MATKPPVTAMPIPVDFLPFMSGLLASVVVFFLLLDSEIVVHELGHAIFAKLAGAEVLTIVIGGKIFRRKRLSRVVEHFPAKPSKLTIRMYAASGSAANAMIGIICILLVLALYRLGISTFWLGVAAGFGISCFPSVFNIVTMTQPGDGWAFCNPDAWYEYRYGTIK